MVLETANYLKNLKLSDGFSKLTMWNVGYLKKKIIYIWAKRHTMSIPDSTKIFREHFLENNLQNEKELSSIMKKWLDDSLGVLIREINRIVQNNNVNKSQAVVMIYNTYSSKPPPTRQHLGDTISMSYLFLTLSLKMMNELTFYFDKIAKVNVSFGQKRNLIKNCNINEYIKINEKFIVSRLI
jgi:hypothetical protein